MRKVILYFMIFPFFLSGQESKSSNKLDMTADFYLSIFDVVDKYERACKFSKTSRYNDFENLFEDSESLVYNDIIPSESYMKNIPPRKYISEIRRLERKRLTVDINVLEIGNIYSSTVNSGFIDVYVSKEMMARFNDATANIIYNDIKESIDWEQTSLLKIQIRYQEYRDTINGKSQYGRVLKISSISEFAKNKEQPIIYVPFAKNSPFTKSQLLIINDITIDDENHELKGKSINYFLHKPIHKGNKIALNNIDDDYRFANVKPMSNHITKKLLFVKKIPVSLRYNVMLANAVNLDFGDDINNLNLGTISFNQDYSFSLSSYLKLPYDLPISNIYPIFGLRFKHTKSTLQFKDAQYSSVNISATDTDNNSYERSHLISNINEKIMLDNNHFFGFIGIVGKLNKLTYGFNIDFLVLPMSNATFESTASAQYTGYYEQYFGLVIDNFEYYKLGEYQLSSSSSTITNTVEYTVAPFSIFEFGFTFDYPVKWQKLSVNINPSLSVITSPWFTKTNDEISTNNSELNSIVSVTDQFKPSNIININFGITRKF